MKSAILLTLGAILCCAGQAEAAYGERISSHMKSPKKYDVTTVTSKLTKPAPKWKPVTLKPATVSTTTPLPSTNAPVNTETMDMSTDNGGQHDEGNQTISGSQSEATFRYVVPPVSPYDQNGIVLLNSLNRPDLRVNDHHQAGPVASLPVYSDHGSPLPARPVDHYSPPLYHDNYQPQVDQQQSYAPPLSNYEPGVSYTNVPSYQSSQNGGHPDQQAYHEEPLEAYLEQSAPAYHHPPVSS
ncbi:hypothetical protein HDE_06045 [Halotydeus destructor]|nr:hypothetical protein HDE_06045 [Halotydeus destructor]